MHKLDRIACAVVRGATETLLRLEGSALPCRVEPNTDETTLSVEIELDQDVQIRGTVPIRVALFAADQLIEGLTELVELACDELPSQKNSSNGTRLPN